MYGSVVSSQQSDSDWLWESVFQTPAVDKMSKGTSGKVRLIDIPVQHKLVSDIVNPHYHIHISHIVLCFSPPSENVVLRRILEEGLGVNVTYVWCGHILDGSTDPGYQTAM